MLLRTVLLLFLCVSVGMCATLGHYQAQEKEEEDAGAIIDTAAADLEAAEEVEAPADAQIQDSHAAEEPEDNSLFGDNFQAEIPKADDSAGVKPEVEVHEEVIIGTKEEPGNEIDGNAGDVQVLEAVTQEKPSHDAAVKQDNPSDEAVTVEKPSDVEAGNEIKVVQAQESVSKPAEQEESSSWGLNSIRNSFQTMHGYFDSLVELVGGHDGVCQYRCRYGEIPQPRPGYQLPEPNGCSSSLIGYELDMGIPAMTTCCNQLDMCYDTCGASKYDCDAKFRTCLHDLCSDINKSLGFVSKVNACESMADTLFNTVWTLGCRPYMNSQRAACVCAEEERDEL